MGWLLAFFAKRLKTSQERYKRFVEDGKWPVSPWGLLRNQVFLGDDNFVKKMQSFIEADRDLSEVPSNQKRRIAKPLSSFANSSNSRNEAIVKAYASGGYKMSELAVYFGLHYSTVSKIIRYLNPVFCDCS